MTKQEAIEQLKFISKVDYHVDTKEAIDTILYLLDESHSLKSQVNVLKEKNFGQSLKITELIDRIEELKNENERLLDRIHNN